jgi:hypothetical protein
MITATLLAYLALLYWFRPFADDDRWKLYVRTALVICSILIAVLDLIKFVEVEGMADEDEELREAQSSNHSSQPFSAIFAYIVFASCMAAIAVLFTAFFLAQYGHRCWILRPRGEHYVISNCSASAKEGTAGGASRSESSQGRDLVARGHRSQFSGGFIEPVSGLGSDSRENALPEGWMAFEDNNGNVYYHNVKTLESTWTRPIGQELPQVVGSHSQSSSNGVISQEIELSIMQKSFSEDGSEFVLNPAQYVDAGMKRNILEKARNRGTGRRGMGWVEVLEESTGRTVYVHEETGAVSLTRPEGWVSEVSKLFSNTRE